MEKINSENVVKLIEFIDDDEYWYIVMDYCESNLQKYLDSEGSLSEK